jgi:hypothetical protein
VSQVEPMVEWGPVAVWAGAVATVLAVAVAIMVAVGAFDRFRGSAGGAHVRFRGAVDTCRAAVGGSGAVGTCRGRDRREQTGAWLCRSDDDGVDRRSAPRGHRPASASMGGGSSVGGLRALGSAARAAGVSGRPVAAQDRPWRILTFLLERAVLTENAVAGARSLVPSVPEVGEEAQLRSR